MKNLFLYPLWIRFWHWLNAILFLVLIVSGISLHYVSDESMLLPFKISMLSHNICGILLSLNYLFYFVLNIISGNYKHYIPELKGYTKKMMRLTRYYLLDIFNNESKPYHPSAKQKFNPLQQITYIFIMFLFMPLIIITGWLLLFPEISPTHLFGMAGIWPTALLHIIVGFLLSVFMLGHIYLGTTGRTVGELFKSMINGWHLGEDDEGHTEDVVLPVYQRGEGKRKILPIIFYNPLTITGSLLSTISFLAILALMGLEYFSESTKAYVGIITFIVLPTLLLFGILLIIIGAIKENRRILQMDHQTKKLPIIDLNNPKHQIATVFFTVGSVLLIAFSIIGSFKAYEYTDSDDFCGNICHKVMEPEYTAYKDSPHSRVGCVKCHIGPGTGWFVKSKISGTYQVYSVLFNKYPRPIPTPVHDLRPAQQTCEQCHWPKHFYSEKKINFDFFQPDENNSETKLTMLLKTGGGSMELGNNSGIHYQMNISNEISYISNDYERMDIPWIKSRNRATGKETIYKKVGAKLTDDMLNPSKMRNMDCIDCHNRPSHIYHQPNKMVNNFMAIDRIDRTLPYIKSLAVQALEVYATSNRTAFHDIKNFIWKFYNSYYHNVIADKKLALEKSIENIYSIYKRNYFSEMKVNWKYYPNNIGHQYSQGCFRCHDGQHVSDDGKVITKDCNACHTIISQEAAGGIPNKVDNLGNIEFIHPGGVDKMIKTKLCPDCHGVLSNRPFPVK